MATLHLKRGSHSRQEEGSRMEAGGLREEESQEAGGRKEGSRKRKGVLQDHIA